jgi:hypothetical protein
MLCHIRSDEGVKLLWRNRIDPPSFPPNLSDYRFAGQPNPFLVPMLDGNGMGFRFSHQLPFVLHEINIGCLGNLGKLHRLRATALCSQPRFNPLAGCPTSESRYQMSSIHRFGPLLRSFYHSLRMKKGTACKWRMELVVVAMFFKNDRMIFVSAC